ncbi:hypothetical protein ACTA71_005052 [Dictyostelium dimigraforme]
MSVSNQQELNDVSAKFTKWSLVTNFKDTVIGRVANTKDINRISIKMGYHASILALGMWLMIQFLIQVSDDGNISISNQKKVMTSVSPGAAMFQVLLCRTNQSMAKQSEDIKKRINKKCSNIPATAISLAYCPYLASLSEETLQP